MADGMGLPHRDASASCPIPGLRRRLEQNAPETVDPFMNRGRFAGWAMGALGAASCCSPALAKDDPGPSLSLDPIVARSLLAPVEDARNPAAAYRLDPLGLAAAGQRVRLSVDVGDATLFAITGKLNRQRTAAGPLDGSHARALGPKRDGGKVYGAGVTRNVRGVDVGSR